MVVRIIIGKEKVLELKEKAVSKKQQRFFGMVRAAQKGEGAASPEVAKVAGEISKKDAKDFAKTKHKGLPEKKTVKEEPERTPAYKAMQRKLYPRGEAEKVEWRNPKNRGKKRKVMAEFEPELEMLETVKGQDTLSRKQGAKERATEKKAHDAWKKSGVGKTKRPLYSATRHTKKVGDDYATQQKQSIKWHHKRTKGKYFPGEQPIGEELTGDLKTDAEKYRVPRGPGGNPIRIGDKVRSMKSTQPLGQLKVKYGADKVRDYYKKNKAVGESYVIEREDSPYEHASRGSLAGKTRSTGTSEKEHKTSFRRKAHRNSAAMIIRAKRKAERSGGKLSDDDAADLAHKGWASSVKHHKSSMTPEQQKRRQKLADTPYKKLTKDEQDKDKVSAKAIMSVHDKQKKAVKEEDNFTQATSELKKTKSARDQRYKTLHKKTNDTGNVDVNENLLKKLIDREKRIMFHPGKTKEEYEELKKKIGSKKKHDKPAVEESTSFTQFMADTQAAKDRQKKKIEDRKKKDAQFVDTRKQGVKFYDKKGSGRIKSGKKIYDK